MIIQLNINGSFFHSHKIEEEEILSDYYALKLRVPANEETIKSHLADIKMVFYKQLCKAHNYEIFLTVESKMHLVKI